MKGRMGQGAEGAQVCLKYTYWKEPEGRGQGVRQMLGQGAGGTLGNGGPGAAGVESNRVQGVGATPQTDEVRLNMKQSA